VAEIAQLSRHPLRALASLHANQSFRSGRKNAKRVSRENFTRWIGRPAASQPTTSKRVLIP
jgi:hypothetical protein